MRWNGARWPRSTIVLLAVVLVAVLVAASLLYGSAGAETRE